MATQGLLYFLFSKGLFLYHCLCCLLYGFLLYRLFRCPLSFLLLVFTS